MIKVNGPDVEIVGSVPDIRTDLAMLTNSIWKALTEKGYTKEEVKEMIFDSVEMGFLNAEEVIEKAMKILRERQEKKN